MQTIPSTNYMTICKKMEAVKPENWEVRNPS